MIIIANWKMYFSTAQTIEFCRTHLAHFSQLTSQHQLIVCPTYTALYQVQEIFKDTQVNIGAQGCSPWDHGPYTGQVSAPSLAQAGATFCIVGHTEQRQFLPEPNQQVALQVAQLIKQKITPIVCVGQQVVDQLMPVLAVATDMPVLIAYEPTWAINSDKAATAEHITTVAAAIAALCDAHAPNLSYQLLYGGSVSSRTIESLRNIPAVKGFLIGRASCDFQELKKIVS